MVVDPDSIFFLENDPLLNDVIHFFFQRSQTSSIQLLLAIGHVDVELAQDLVSYGSIFALEVPTDLILGSLL